MLAELRMSLQTLEDEELAEATLALVPAHVPVSKYGPDWPPDLILSRPGTYESKTTDLLVLEEQLAYHRLGTEEVLRNTAEEQLDADQKLREMLRQASSDDSDGFDADHEKEWRDQTRRIFSVCRAVEVAHGDAECNAFADLLADLRRGFVEGDIEPLTLTEVQMIWDAVRFAYRHADPVHNKHWLTHATQIVTEGHLQHRISILNYLHVMRAAADFAPLSDRHRRKVQRWLARAMVLFHKRVLRLADYGVIEPTWHQVNVSGTDRKEYVPLTYLWDLVNQNTDRHKVSSLEYEGLNAQFKAPDDDMVVVDF